MLMKLYIKKPEVDVNQLY